MDCQGFIPGLIALMLGILGACRSESSQPAQATPAAGSQVSPENSGDSVHFFSVAWGCVQIAQAQLESAAYQVQDYATKAGSCPQQIAVVDQTASQLLTCQVKIGAPEIPGTYILYDKRSLDGSTVTDLRSEGFSEANFCPMLAQKKFK